MRCVFDEGGGGTEIQRRNYRSRFNGGLFSTLNLHGLPWKCGAGTQMLRLRLWTRAIWIALIEKCPFVHYKA